MAIPRRGSTLRAQWLGQLLRKAREHADVTNKDAGAYIQRDGSTISRMEAGITPARVSDVWALMNLYRVEDRMRPVYEQLSREIWQTGWWEGYTGAMGELFVDHAWLESRAAEILSFDAITIPGLVQTREYAEALMTAEPELSEEQRTLRLEYRLKRQRILEAEEPPTVKMILDEAILHRRIGGADVMRAQLQRLLDDAGAGRIEVRVLAFDSGAHASPDGPFTIIQLPDSFPPVAYVQSPAGVTYLEDNDAQRLIQTFERLDRLALGPDKSAAVIERIARTMK